MLVERCRVHYNTVRPHSSLSYRPSALKTWASTRLGGEGNRYTYPASPLPHGNYRNSEIAARYTNKQSGSKGRAGQEQKALHVRKTIETQKNAGEIADQTQSKTS